MTEKNLVQFSLEDNTPIFVETEGLELSTMQRVSRTKEGIEIAQVRFQQALSHLKPAAEMVLQAFREVNQPSEISLEFGIKLNGQIGAVFASVNSEATFKVTLKWKNESSQKTSIS